MPPSHTQIVEIDGIKMEIDLRTAKRVEGFRVGSRVKLMVKNDYSGPKIHTGTIVAFEPFESLPTIVVSYIDGSYNANDPLPLAYINEKTRDKYEMIADIDEAPMVDKADVLNALDRKIEEARAKLHDLEHKRNYFLTKFGTFYGEVTAHENHAEAQA